MIAWSLVYMSYACARIASASLPRTHPYRTYTEGRKGVWTTVQNSLRPW